MLECVPEDTLSLSEDEGGEPNGDDALDDDIRGSDGLFVPKPTASQEYAFNQKVIYTVAQKDIIREELSDFIRSHLGVKDSDGKYPKIMEREVFKAIKARPALQIFCSEPYTVHNVLTRVRSEIRLQRKAAERKALKLAKAKRT